MSVIYKPKGAAREYSELACNLYKGCPHGCKYCYVPNIPPWKFKSDARYEFHKTRMPKKEVVQQFEQDAKKLYGAEKEILFCFTCDPFAYRGDNRVTMECLQIADQYKLKNIQILTKGGKSAMDALPLIAKNGWKFAQTVVFADDALRQKYEPNASPIEERLEMCKRAQQVGTHAWVSMEPVINTEQAKAVYEMFCEHVDFWKVGKINHAPEIERQSDWTAFTNWVLETIPPEKLYLKKSLQKYKTEG